jgi:hypothetical protein
MSLLSDHIIPGNSGKVFTTDASKERDLNRIKRAILRVDGIADVLIVKEVFPSEFIVHTKKLVRITDIENAVKPTGFHAIPKGVFHWESQEPK